MQITIDVPDNLPHSFIQQGIAAFKEKLNQLQDNEEFKIDPQACLDALEKIKRGDKTGLTEITDVKEYIANLRNEIRNEIS